MKDVYTKYIGVWNEQFPTLVSGWPDEEFNVTQKDYKDALDEDEDLPPYDQWREQQLAEHGDSPGYQEFSWSRCDLCGSHLGGPRYPMTALPEDPATNPDYIALSVCIDCYEEHA
jgi:hypothetical protein